MESISWWNPNLDADETFRMIINASTNSGKSFLVESLLRKYGDEFDMILIVCPSRDQLRRYARSIPRGVKIVSSPSIAEAENKIKFIFQTQDELEDFGEPLFRILMIFDDVGFDPKSKHASILMKTWANGRHSKISAIFISQYHSMISPQMKNNTQIFVIMRLGSYQQLEYITKNFLLGTVSIPDNVRIKEATYISNIYKSLIKSRGDSLVVDNRIYENNLFYYKA